MGLPQMGTVQFVKNSRIGALDCFHDAKMVREIFKGGGGVDEAKVARRRKDRIVSGFADGKGIEVSLIISQLQLVMQIGLCRWILYSSQ